MDLNELKNLNMQDLKAKVLAFADKKTLIKIGISLGSIIVFFPAWIRGLVWTYPFSENLLPKPAKG